MEKTKIEQIQKVSEILEALDTDTVSLVKKLVRQLLAEQGNSYNARNLISHYLQQKEGSYSANGIQTYMDEMQIHKEDF